MKKFVAILLLAILITTILSACGGDDDNSLVGTWEYRRRAGAEVGVYVYIFHADGTGTRGFDEMMEDFTWTADTSGEVILTLAPYWIEDWNYSISGRTLTLSFWTEEIRLTRAS